MPNLTSDTLGNAITLADPASQQGINDFVDGFLRCEARVANVLQAGEHDESPYVQACCAALHMFSESGEGPPFARPFIERAMSSGLEITSRERLFVASVSSWVNGDIDRSVALLEQLLQEHPRDLASLKLAQYHLFNKGDSAAMLRLALQSMGSAADVAQLHGMAAFGWEQCHFLEQAERAARRAIDMEEREPWAQHALAHVMLTQGRLQEGRAFMQAASPGWTGLNSFMVTHAWWHLALFLVELDLHDEALVLYDTQVWGVVKAYSQDQIGAVSLLARLELAGVNVGNRWQDVGQHILAHANDHVLPFLDLQYLYGLARAGLPQADTMIHSIEAHAATREGPNGEVWRRVCVPAGHGLLAHARGEFATAVESLGVALPRLIEIGGSHAQRDLFEQVHLDALIRSGRQGAALHLVQQRARQAPESIRLQRLAGQVHQATGLADWL